MRKLCIFLTVAIVATGAMAQGPRGHHNNRHGHGDSHRRPPIEQRYHECASPEQMQAVMTALNGLRAIVRQHIGTETETEKKINHMYTTLCREHFVSYWA